MWLRWAISYPAVSIGDGVGEERCRRTESADGAYGVLTHGLREFGYDRLEMQNQDLCGGGVSRNMSRTRHMFFLELRSGINYLAGKLNSLDRPLVYGVSLRCLFVRDVGRDSMRGPVTA